VSAKEKSIPLWLVCLLKAEFRLQAPSDGSGVREVKVFVPTG
jgi:hypothetical protein